MLHTLSCKRGAGQKVEVGFASSVSCPNLCIDANCGATTKKPPLLSQAVYLSPALQAQEELCLNLAGLTPSAQRKANMTRAPLANPTRCTPEVEKTPPMSKLHRLPNVTSLACTHLQSCDSHTWRSALWLAMS